MKIPGIEKAARYFNERNPREKKLLLGFFFVLVLGLDVMGLIRPAVGGILETLPQTAQEKQRLFELKEDEKNEALIRKRRQDTAVELEEKEKAFVAPSELPALLEKLSQLALDSGVRIMSVDPVAPPKAPTPSRYTPVPIRVSAVAGTHELGEFLEKLENGEIFFRVAGLNLAANPADERRHFVQLEVTAYYRGRV